MIAVLLALGSALAYGVSDFVGGVVSQRVSPWVVAVVGQGTGVLAVGGLALVLGGEASRADLGWAVLGGLGQAAGVALLYRGLGRGRMGVVAPSSGLVAALVPVVVGLATGERPSAVVLVGLVAALPGIYLVAATPAAAEEGSRPSGLGDGLGAGVGFGLLFATTAQLRPEAGVVPLALMQAVSLVALAGGAVAGGVRVWPLPREARGAAWCGGLGAIAVVLFLAASGRGLLTVVAVIASLYPAATVVLAAVLLHERVARGQAVGLALCAVAVGLVAAG